MKKLLRERKVEMRGAFITFADLQDVINCFEERMFGKLFTKRGFQKGDII